MAEHQVLFCPFCRESFEGHELCPEHELALVSFDKVPTQPLVDPRDDELGEPGEGGPEAAVLDPALSLFSLRHGRGCVALGALLVALALGLDFLRFADAGVIRTFELARARPSLWTLALVSFTVLFALARRRTLLGLRGLRLIVPLLSAVPILTIGLTLQRGLSAQVSLGSAFYVVVFGSLLLLWGGLRLGEP